MVDEKYFSYFWSELNVDDLKFAVKMKIIKFQAETSLTHYLHL